MERLTEKFVCNLPNEVLVKLGIADVPRGGYEIKEVFGSTCKEVCEEHECSNCPIQKVISKLADYEDAEEQGLLLRLPCKVGDTVYKVWYKPCHLGETTPDSFDCICCNDKCDLKLAIFECKVDSLTFIINEFVLTNKNTVYFLTKEEAEQALKQMGE